MILENGIDMWIDTSEIDTKGTSAKNSIYDPNNENIYTHTNMPEETILRFIIETKNHVKEFNFSKRDLQFSSIGFLLIILIILIIIKKRR